MKIGIIEILTESAPSAFSSALYGWYRKKFASIMPQVIAVWCHQLGHEVHYTTYYGQSDPLRLLPDELDVLFVSSYTQASPWAYVLSKLFRKRGALTVIGGAHARSFPLDCQRFFDLVVHDCDRILIDDILSGRFDPPQIITSFRPLAELPSVEERWPYIEASTFNRGAPARTNVVPILASTGCPFTCDFCVDWNTEYVARPTDSLRQDLEYLSRKWPRVNIGYHDPNFAVQFDTTLNTIESIPEGRRNPYIIESSLSILKTARLDRLRDTNCIYIAPGIELWIDYSNKAGAVGKKGWEKLERVTNQLKEISEYRFGIQANLIFGVDSDNGSEPVEITKTFIASLPEIWPAVNIPFPFGGTPLHDQMLKSGRILKAIPFSFYFNPYLTIIPKNYHPAEYYNYLIAIMEHLSSSSMMMKRMATGSRLEVRLVHTSRHISTKLTLKRMRKIKNLLDTDSQFRKFHEGLSEEVPMFYHLTMDRNL